MGEHFSCFYLPEDLETDQPAMALRLAGEVGRCEEEGWRVFSIVVSFMGLVMIAVVVLAEIFAPKIVSLIAPGFGVVEKEHVVSLTRLMLPAQFCFYMGGILSAVLGCLMVLPLNGITTGIGNSNFSETAFNFHVSGGIMLIGMAFAVVLGAAGGLFPASNAARKEILTALREI